MNSVTIHGHVYALLPEKFYHLSPPPWFSYVNDAANFGEGLVLTKSGFERAGLSRTNTPYFLYHGGSHKERLWEEIRITGFSQLPSRANALFLYDDYDTAKRANDEWFRDEARHILEVRVLSKPYALVHRADARWLDEAEQQWGSAARSYWSSKVTGDPMMEAIVQGWVYFPGWQSPPFYTIPKPKRDYR